jgi:replicative DNA helicase
VSDKAFLPVEPAAEESVLSSLLTSPEVFLDISELLTPEDFGIRANQDIYRAVIACDSTGRPVDAITVTDELRRSKRLGTAGGKERIEALSCGAAPAGNVLAHAAIVADKARLRGLLLAGRAIVADATAPDADAAAALAGAEEKVFELGKPRSGSTLLEMAQAVPRVLEDLAKARTSVLVGHSTGLATLDRLTGGLQGGQLIILAARPAMGKSALALQLARHIAETTGLSVPLLSYEMSVSEIGMRMLSTALQYDLLKLRQGDIPTDMERDLATAAQRMAALPMLIDDNPPETIGGVRSAMRRLARRRQIGAVVVDYLQLMSAERQFGGSENRTQEVSEISRGLKRLATELDVPVIALSQLNRQLEQRPNKRPNLSDLRESGSLEQDANAVLFLYREHVYNAAADAREAELIIAKQRSGPLGTVPVLFDGACATFTEDPRPRTAAAPAASQQSRGGSPF